jgi:hypothetical protein
MFRIINQIANNRKLAPGTYDLANLANEDNDLKAKISHYTTDMSSADYPLRALVFGNESAKITGQVVVNPDGSKTFKQIEIRPFDTNFDFEHNTWNVPLEAAREVARRKYDPENQGVSYDIQYRGPGPDRGTGRIYDPFSDSELNAALHKKFVYPNSGPPWLLSSVTGKPPLPFVDEYGQYLDQTNGAQASASNAGAPAVPSVPPANRNTSSNDIGNWLASLAGVDPCVVVAALLISFPAYAVPCWAVRKAVAQYGEATVEAWARSKGIPEREIEKARSCLRRVSMDQRFKRRVFEGLASVQDTRD